MLPISLRTSIHRKRGGFSRTDVLAITGKYKGRDRDSIHYNKNAMNCISTLLVKHHQNTNTNTTQTREYFASFEFQTMQSYLRTLRITVSYGQKIVNK